MRYIVVITLLLAAMLAGCAEDGTIASGGGRGLFAGRCYKLQNDSALAHLDANTAGLSGSTLGDSQGNWFTVWSVPGGPQGSVLIYVKDNAGGNHWQARYASMRVCADHQIVPGEPGTIINGGRGRNGYADASAEWYIGYYR